MITNNRPEPLGARILAEQSRRRARVGNSFIALGFITLALLVSVRDFVLAFCEWLSFEVKT